MEQMPQVMAVCSLEDIHCTSHGGQCGAETLTQVSTTSAAAWAAPVEPAPMYEHVWIPLLLD